MLIKVHECMLQEGQQMLIPLEIYLAVTYIIIWSTQQIAIKIWIPWQAVPFLGVTLKSDIRTAFTVGIWQAENPKCKKATLITLSFSELFILLLVDCKDKLKGCLE